MLTPSVEIIRLEENHEYGTFGILRINKEIFACTLEPKDENNMVNVSSIPAQQYDCELRPTELNSVRRLGMTDAYEVMNVPGRSAIKIHPGNTDDDTLGCILIGEKFGLLKNVKSDRAILNSGNTFLRFMAVMSDYDRLHLTITEKY